jgi:hypothetical protein
MGAVKISDMFRASALHNANPFQRPTSAYVCEIVHVFRAFRLGGQRGWGARTAVKNSDTYKDRYPEGTRTSDQLPATDVPPTLPTG